MPSKFAQSKFCPFSQHPRGLGVCVVNKYFVSGQSIVQTLLYFSKDSMFRIDYPSAVCLANPTAVCLYYPTTVCLDYPSPVCLTLINTAPIFLTFSAPKGLIYTWGKKNFESDNCKCPKWLSKSAVFLGRTSLYCIVKLESSRRMSHCSVCSQLVAHSRVGQRCFHIQA